MKFPVAFVVAVLIWCSSKYIPPYFLELRKMQIMEERFQLDSAKQVALLRQIRMQLQANTRTTADEPATEQRFY